MDYQHVLNFWFDEIDPALWWKGDRDLDKKITKKFRPLHDQAKACELFTWRQMAKGRLAEIIVLDQFSRNMFRGLPQAFAQDALALALAQEAVALGQDAPLTAPEKSFLYLPYMHSESLMIQDLSLKLYEQPGLEGNLEFAIKHRNIIERFGRYPHRNLILGRSSTKEETEFLKEPDSSF